MKGSIWQRRLFLWLAVVVAAVRANTDLYNLPSFSLVLNVDKSENALIVFQDRLNMVIQVHLDAFFSEKMESKALVVQGGVEKLSLASAYIWKELSTSYSAQDGEGSNNRKLYEVRSNFDCQLELSYLTSDDGDDSRISQSIMDLFLIEAFQGDNYWNLVHAFLKDDVLEDITGVKITVMTDGYVHYNGQDPSIFDGYDTDGDWTPAMIAGVIFATLLVVSLAVMWTYICCFTRDSICVQCTRFGRKTLMEKVETATDDDMYSTSTLNPEEEEREEGRWMDAWAESVTSIPIRQPVKKTRKSKKAPSIRHPAQHHSSYLNSIEEADDECSTVCSVGSVESSRSQHDSKRRRMRTTKTNRATSTLEEDQADHNDDRSTTSNSSQQKSRPNYLYGRADQHFEYHTSQPQLERINELV